MSSRQSSSFRRTYSRCRSFMNGSLSVGRYSRSIGSTLLPFLPFLSSALPFLLLSNCMSLLRTHDWCEVLPARLAYISMVGDRDNNDDDVAGGVLWRRPASRGPPCPLLIYLIISII